MNEQLKTFPNNRIVNNNKRPSPLPDLCDCSPDDALKKLDTARSGLTPEQVEARLEQYGPNGHRFRRRPRRPGRQSGSAGDFALYRNDP
jgi:hypothetical protein